MSEVIRVLHVTGVPEGGVIGLLLSLHRAIDRDAVQFDIVMPDSAPFDSAAAKLVALGGRAFMSPALRYRNFLKLNAYFDGFFREHPEYRIIHAHGVNTAVLCLKHAKRNGVPHRICHSHNTKYADYPIRAVRNGLLMRGLGGCATGYMACSRAAGEFLFGDKDFVVVRNGIPVSEFAYDAGAREKLRREFNIGNDFVIGNIGLFRRQKNHAFMIRVLKSYRGLYGEGKLLLVGDGELLDDTKQLAYELGLREHVVFTGIRRDVAELLSAMDVFLMTSFYEGFGIALIEALASGLPCVYSDTIPSEVQLTDLVHPLSLDDRVDTWVEAIHQARYLPRISRINEIAAKGYDISESASKLTEYYHALVSGGS